MDQINNQVELLRHKADVAEEFKSIAIGYNGLSSRIQTLESNHLEFKATLMQHSKDREENHIELDRRISQLYTWFGEHDVKEMEKYDEITVALTSLGGKIDNISNETHDNSTFIAKVRKYWFGLTIGASALVATAAAVWWIISQMESRGLLILFPTGS